MYYIITNPLSRSGHSQQKLLLKMERALEESGISYQTLFTEKKNDAERFAAQITETCADCVIIVIGGDGTINGVINGISDFSRVRFGFIPAGSANDLAAGLGIRDRKMKGRLEEYISHIVRGKVLRTIDLGQITYEDGRSRRFAVSAGIGFDAAICKASDTSGERRIFNALHLGKLTYGVIALRQLFSAPKVRCDITLSNGRVFNIKKLIFATFMNTPMEGGGYKFAPDAVPDDGKINVSAIGDMSKFTVLVNFPAAHRGTYYRVDGVYHDKASKLHIEADEPLWVHTDGEVERRANVLDIACIPGVLRLIV